MTGVRIPRSQTVDPEERGAPFSAAVGDITLMVPVTWCDERGEPHKEYVFVMGDTVCRDPNGEEWAARVRTFNAKVAPKIVKATNAKLKTLVLSILQELGVTHPVPEGLAGAIDVLADETDHDVAAPAQ
jgi:hypothetical protein